MKLQNVSMVTVEKLMHTLQSGPGPSEKVDLGTSEKAEPDAKIHYIG